MDLTVDRAHEALDECLRAQRRGTLAIDAARAYAVEYLEVIGVPCTRDALDALIADTESLSKHEALRANATAPLHAPPPPAVTEATTRTDAANELLCERLQCTCVAQYSRATHTSVAECCTAVSRLLDHQVASGAYRKTSTPPVYSTRIVLRYRHALHTPLMEELRRVYDDAASRRIVFHYPTKERDFTEADIFFVFARDPQ